MKVRILGLLLAALPILTFGQQTNIFYDRAFWKSSPDVQTVEGKIAEGNDPVALNSYAFDATVYAILENAPLVTIRFLLDMDGNEVNKMTHDGRNYYLWAAYKGNLDLLKYLVEQSAQTDLVDDHGNNAMTFAANAGQTNTEVYDFIIANGLPANATNRSGATALLLLTPYLEDDRLVKYFTGKGLDVHGTDDVGNGMFNYAARTGNMEMMQWCVENGLDYQGLNKEGGNAMMFASLGSRGRTNPLSVFEYLEELGVKPNVVTNEGRTPLHNLASRAKDTEVMTYFIGKGVDINQSDGDGNTAFLNALRSKNTVAVNMLLPSVEDLNQQNVQGYSALTYAVTSRSLDNFEMLLSNGADARVVDSKGRGLVFHMYNSYRESSQDAFAKFTATAKEQGLSFNEKYEGGNTLVHLAVEKNSEYLLRQALTAGLDVNAKNDDGLTPLHVAAMKATNNELMKALIAEGADKSIRTDFEESAYDLALENELLGDGTVDLAFLKLD